MVVKEVEMVEGVGMTSTFSSSGSASLEGATPTQSVPDFAIAIGAPIYGPKVLGLFLMAFFLLPSGVCLSSTTAQITLFDTYLIAIIE